MDCRKWGCRPKPFNFVLPSLTWISKLYYADTVIQRDLTYKWKHYFLYRSSTPWHHSITHKLLLVVAYLFTVHHQTLKKTVKWYLTGLNLKLISMFQFVIDLVFGVFCGHCSQLWKCSRLPRLLRKKLFFLSGLTFFLIMC